MDDVAAIRKEYALKELDVDQVDKNPINQFKNWFQEALDADLVEPNAMNVSTVSSDGKPTSRILLLKGIEDGGFVFFTNYKSRKGQELAQNPNICLNFFWAGLERQVRIEGTVEKISVEESTTYFHSRPRGSQIGAHVSPQSQVLEDRKALIQKEKELTREFEGKEVPKPDHWGGYLVTPNLIEFWQGRPSRLHDRIVYKLEGNNWKINRLAP
ncbi:MAG: pyridoxamine 5'-phosphate oxidase [Thalassobius sp.]|nr:pyridoxamine 5'-phosphate oxidase [Thalassovita sp.]